jgi:hypothetical protein
MRKFSESFFWLWEPETPEDEVVWNAARDAWHLKVRTRSRTAVFFRKAGLRRLPCVCGHAETQMHHVDYHLWYMVGFLCSKCHRYEHLGRLKTPYEVHDLRWLAVADVVTFA